MPSPCPRNPDATDLVCSLLERRKRLVYNNERAAPRFATAHEGQDEPLWLCASVRDSSSGS